MRAVIYARKSTDQSRVADDAKSVTRQVELARGLAAAKGWAVDKVHVYTADGIGGASATKLLSRFDRTCLQGVGEYNSVGSLHEGMKLHL